ncbi:hypothetical protein [Phenylobacterium sp.]
MRRRTAWPRLAARRLPMRRNRILAAVLSVALGAGLYLVVKALVT